MHTCSEGIHKNIQAELARELVSEFTRDVAEQNQGVGASPYNPDEAGSFSPPYVAEIHLEFTLACSGESLSTFTSYPLPIPCTGDQADGPR